MGILTGFLYVVLAIIALVLVVLILIQPSKGGGLGSAFGGIGETVFGPQVMSHLSKLTIVLIAVFFVLTLILAVIAGHSGSANVESDIVGMAQTQVAENSDASASEAVDLSQSPQEQNPAVPEK